MENLEDLARRKRLDLSQLTDYWSVTEDTWQGQPCLRIPYDGNVVRYRTAKGMRVDKGVKMKGRVYGAKQAWRKIQENVRPTLWLVEGESDTWAATEAGLIAAGLPGATTWTSTGQTASKLAQALKGQQGQAIWLSDNDHAGHQARIRMMEEDLGLWLDFPFWYMILPGYKDLGEAWQNLGLSPDEFKEWLLDQAATEVTQLTPEPAQKHWRRPGVAREDAVSEARAGWLQDYVNDARAATSGNRNNTLRKCAYEAARRLEGSGWSEGQLTDALMSAGQATGLPQSEVRYTVAKAVKDGQADAYKPPDRPVLPPVVSVPMPVPDVPDQPTEATPDEFWQQDPVLKELWQWSVKRFASPTGLLGSLLAYTCLCVSYQWRLPPPGLSTPEVQGNASPVDAPHLGSYILLVGRPGGGKSRAIGAAGNIMEFQFMEHGDLAPAIDHPPSKQGLIRMFQAGTQKQEDGSSVPVYRHYGLVQTGEGEEFAALSSQEKRGQGWGLRSALRDLWKGDTPIGSHGSVAERQHRLPAHVYAAGCLIAVQHENATEVLGRTAVGDNQRWLVLPAKPTGIDPDLIPEVSSYPTIRIHPDWHTISRWTWLGVADEVAQARDAWLKAIHGIYLPTEDERQEWSDTGHGEHTMLLRLKLAANLLILLGRPPVVDWQTWCLAGQLMMMSNEERSVVAEHDHQNTLRKYQLRGQAKAISKQAERDAFWRQYEAKVEEVVRMLPERLGKDPVGRRRFHQVGRPAVRHVEGLMPSADVIDDLLDLAIGQGVIEEVGKKYQLKAT